MPLADDAKATYRDLVIRVARGEASDDAAILDALILSGRSLPTFQKDVGLIVQRIEAAEKMTAVQNSDKWREGKELCAEGTRLC